MVPDSSTCGAFPTGIVVSELTFFSALNAVARGGIILCDRGNILKSILLSMLFRRKLVVRMLGLGGRLRSKRLLSLRSVYAAATRIFPPELVISTIDGSFDPGLYPITAKTMRHRINGAHEAKIPQLIRETPQITKSKFFFIGRDAEEKGALEVLNYFQDLNELASELHFFGLSAPPPGAALPRSVRSRITFHGFVDRPEIEALLPKMSIMISANKLGCLGNAELEAICFGKPIIYLGSSDHLQFIPKELRQFYLSPERYKKDRETALVFRTKASVESFEYVHDTDASMIMALLSTTKR